MTDRTGPGGAHAEEARDADLIVSLGHPLRRRILRTMILAEAPTFPRGIADELKEPLSNVSYHVRVLLDRGTVALHDTEPVRGSLKHLYDPKIDEEWARAALGLAVGDPAAEEESAEPSDQSSSTPAGS
jgi:hypothetical protein